MRLQRVQMGSVPPIQRGRRRRLGTLCRLPGRHFRIKLGCMFASRLTYRELAAEANVWAGDELMREERS